MERARTAATCICFEIAQHSKTTTYFVCFSRETRTKQIGNLEFYVRSLTYDE